MDSDFGGCDPKTGSLVFEAEQRDAVSGHSVADAGQRGRPTSVQLPHQGRSRQGVLWHGLAGMSLGDPKKFKIIRGELQIRRSCPKLSQAPVSKVVCLVNSSW